MAAQEIDPQLRKALEEIDTFGSEIYRFIDVVYREEEDALRWAKSDLKEIVNNRDFFYKKATQENKKIFLDHLRQIPKNYQLFLCKAVFLAKESRNYRCP